MDCVHQVKLKSVSEAVDISGRNWIYTDICKAIIKWFLYLNSLTHGLY